MQGGGGLAGDPDGRGGPAPVDVLIASLGSTQGLRMADEQLREFLEGAGASVAVARAEPPRPVRTLMLTDLAWARAARVAVREAIAGMAAPPRAIVYSSTTAAMLWERPGAIRFDATSAGNRPGRDGLWQRPLEGRRLKEAPLLLPWSEGAVDELHNSSSMQGRTVVLPVAVAPSGPREGTRDIAAMTYAANPAKKGLGRVIEAWGRARGELGSETVGELMVAGASARELERSGLGREEGVRVLGVLGHEEYRALLRRTRLFVCAPRREDYGIAQLEALVDGCRLVTTPAPGPYVALSIASQLDERLVGEDLLAGLRAALIDPLSGYRELADRALAAFTPAAVKGLVTATVLPRLLEGGQP